MTEPEFWKLIASTKRSDMLEQVEKLTAKVSKFAVSEIVGFGHWWFHLHNEAYRWNLWGAAYLINGGCSDDGFIDFRSWLLLKGEDVYKAALADPDSLSKVRVEPDDAACECYAASKSYTLATGETDSGVFFREIDKAYGESPPYPEPLGEQWDFDDDTEMKMRLPKLYKKFGAS